MTTSTNWPNPGRPVVPMFPERRGWHILDRNTREWCPTRQAWNDAILHPSFVKAINMAWREYHGPCLTPTQISEMLAAERERCLAAFAAHGDRAELGYNDSTSDEEKQYWRGALNTFEECRDEIRNLGTAP